MKVSVLLIAIGVTFFGMVSDASKILVLTPLATKSHMNFIGEISKVLGVRGHEVTIYTSHETKGPNITWLKSNTDRPAKHHNRFNSGRLSSLQALQEVPLLCTKSLKEFNDYGIDVKSYDLLIIEGVINDCFFTLTNGVPFIIAFPNSISSVLHEIIGNVHFSSIEPLLMLDYRHPLSFKERFINSLVTSALSLYIKYIYMPTVIKVCHDAGLCEEHQDLFNMASKTSMVFMNSIRSLENPIRPLVPTVISAGGLNCRPAQPLPEDISAWFDEAGDAGVIYFSLGSIIKSSDIPPESRSALINVFRSLPQRILWKTDDEHTEGLPDNVRLIKWAPQQDVLGHPAVRLFMTHGGLFSTTEALYHNVPVIGLPVFSDQFLNMESIKEAGWGDVIQWNELNEQLLNNTINELLSNKKYFEAVSRLSAIMKDVPMTPSETVVYWTEYVIRHKGAPHLQSPIRNMHWYELYNVDVWVILSVIGLMLLTLTAYVFKLTIKLTLKIMHYV